MLPIVNHHLFHSKISSPCYHWYFYVTRETSAKDYVFRLVITYYGLNILHPFPISSVMVMIVLNVLCHHKLAILPNVFIYPPFIVSSSIAVLF